MYRGLASMATITTSLDWAPSIWSAWRNSWAMIGQSDVQTGSRNVSAIVLPCKTGQMTPAGRVGRPG